MVELSGNSPRIGTAISVSPTLKLGLMMKAHFRFQPPFRSAPRITDLVDSTAEAVARVLEDISNLSIDSATINHFADLIAGRAKLVRLSI